MNNEITKFLSNFKDFLRPNRFKVIFHFPKFSTMELEKLSMLVDSTEIPKDELNNVKITRMGKNIVIPFEEGSYEFTITFLLDENYIPLKIFKKIYKDLNKTIENVYKSFNEFNNFEIEIIQYNLDLTEKKFKYTFKRTIPTSVSEIKLEHSDKRNIEKITVSFSAYDVEYEELK